MGLRYLTASKTVLAKVSSGEVKGTLSLEHVIAIATATSDTGSVRY